MRPIERIEPGRGQESVWDYPRPPSVVATTRHVVVEHAGLTIADSRRAFRVCETAGPPVYYLPPLDVRVDLLRPRTVRRTFCEWKGLASYWDLRVGRYDGGWITDDVVGPFKGDPGTEDW